MEFLRKRKEFMQQAISWQHTAVPVVTEFGRAVAPNGSGGTDHGTGGVAFIVGGAVRGGRVISD